MERAIIVACLCMMIDCSVIKWYRFYSSEMTWTEAQAFCRKKNTELALVQSETDQQKFQRLAQKNVLGWIGLYRDSASPGGWAWSGGWYGTFTNWGPADGNNVSETRVAADHQGLWYDMTEDQTLPVYCVHTYTLMEMEKSWEEALEHCRGNGSDLIRVDGNFRYSQTMKLMQKDVVDRVWVGLRFLGGHWLWNNIHSKMDVPWSQEVDPCPLMHRCGALTKDGLFENRDCQERLHFVCNNN